MKNKTTEERRSEIIEKGRLNTIPGIPLFLAYDSHCLDTDEVPRNSICNFTISGLKCAFPDMKIEQGANEEVIIDGESLGFSAMPPGGTDDQKTYMKGLILEIFLLHFDNEKKIPDILYKWYLND